MHKKAVASLIILMLFCLPYVTRATAGWFPFGGIVTFVEECDEGLLLTVQVPQVAGPMITEWYMWFYGELPFAFYVAPHIGQWLLGEAMPTPQPCTVEGEPIGEGFPIIYHGESF